MTKPLAPNTRKLLIWACGLLALTPITGNQTLAATLNNQLMRPSSSTDFFRVTCSKNDHGDTSKLRVTLLDESPDNRSIISAQAMRGLLAMNITDTNRKDNKPSPAANVAGGNGAYEIRVNKTGPGVKKYKLDYRCLTNGNQWAGTAIATVQNQ